METELLIRGGAPQNVFAVFGDNENIATYSLAWTLSQSPALLNALVEDLGLPAVEAAHISAQKEGKDGGYTDLEIVAGAAHLVLEAKVGWQLPATAQLERYLPRLQASGTANPRILTVSAASRNYASRVQAAELDGVPVTHRSWGDLHALATGAYSATRSVREKMWLEQLIGVLAEYRIMQQTWSNKVYIVSLSYGEVRPGSAYTWIDVVEKDNAYYHPIGIGGWPPIAPNYLGFRYNGALQAIRHVESSQLVRQPSDVDPRWSDSDDDHLVYRLGPAIVPAQRLPTGSIYPSGRKWAAIDLLLSGAAATIYEAAEMTKQREQAAGA